MFVLYTRTELGYDDPEMTNWLTETIAFVKYERSGLSSHTRNDVNKFADGDASGVYKHCVPYDRILKTLINGLEGKKRGEIIGQLDTIMMNLQVKDPLLIEPQTNRVAFDTWVEWAFESLCDWPPNIYRWTNSTGDGGGTKLDKPMAKPPAVSPPVNLMDRLGKAAQALNKCIGVSLKETEPRL